MASRAEEPLIVRRTIRATPERLFTAWTTPAQLRVWWGPDGVTCVDPTIDLRVGGTYRIGNRLHTGAELWIGGVFEIIEPPHRLVYTWKIEGAPGAPERVTVEFTPRGGSTDLIITHERIANRSEREQHANGWVGCLDGLVEFLGR